MPRLPSICDSCGAVFPTRVFNFGGNIEHLKLAGNTETCPFCGEVARLSEGVFKVTDDVVTVLSAPEITHQMLCALGDLAKIAYNKRTPVEFVEEQAKKIHPAFGELIKRNRATYSLPVLLLIIVMSIKSCAAKSGVDANVSELVDRIQHTAPQQVFLDQKHLERAIEVKIADDPLFADTAVYRDDGPDDLVSNHDDYLYGDAS